MTESKTAVIIKILIPGCLTAKIARKTIPANHTTESSNAIIINIDVMLAKRKMSVTELSEKVGITMANISILKNGKAKAIKVDTLNKICRALDCQPGDILEYVPSDDEI